MTCQLKYISDAVRLLCQKLDDAGGQAWLVGGCVRDMLLHTPPKDWDIEVFGLEESLLGHILSTLGRCEKVGKHFGVYKLWLKDIEVDIALPRQERKAGQGHKGFAVVCNPHLSPKQSSLRRDFTINAMMLNPATGELLDFHHGQQDLENRVLRHVSPAFIEDPLRPLRAMQFAARFDLTLSTATAELCRNILGEAGTLPIERVWQEWLKWSQSAYPSQGLQALRDMGWDSLYPELVALQACPQDVYWHPEGDVWVHTKLVVNEAARLSRARCLSAHEVMVLVFAALCHDLGKPITTYTNNEGKVVSPNHGQAGVQPSIDLLKRIGAPQWLSKYIPPLVQEHVAHFSCAHPSARAVRRLALRLAPANIVMWEMLTEADAGGRHPAPKSRPALAWLKLAEQEHVHQDKAQPIVTGKLLKLWGVAPSPAMGEIIKAAYQAQLDGDFLDDVSALSWLEKQGLANLNK